MIAPAAVSLELGSGHHPGRAPLLLRPPNELLLLALALALVFLLPARLVLPALGAAGRPAVLFGTGLTVLWACAWLQRGGGGPSQPVRWLVLTYALYQTVSWAVGFDRGLPPPEARSADRWLLLTVGMAGFALFTADSLRTRVTLDRFLLAMTWGGGAMGMVGALQFLLGVDLTQYVSVPGLRRNIDLIGIGARGEGFARVAGTASHYIEFGVVLSMVLPIALHYAFFARTKASRRRRWLIVVLLGSAVPFSVSRSGMLAVLVALVVLASVWPWRLRYNALIIGLAAVAAYRVVQPGLLGTIRSLFTNAQDDPSVTGRTDDYAIVFGYIGDRPIFGRGAGTFMPERYILLDNQFLLTWVSGGLLGLAALLLLLMGAYWLARSIRLRGSDEETRHLGQALAASVMVAIVSSLTFDSLSFTSFSCVTFMIVGSIGALWRLDGCSVHRPLQSDQDGATFVAPPWMARRRGVRP